MTDTEFLQEAITRLRQFEGEQQQLQAQYASDFQRMHFLRHRLVALTGTLAAGLGLTIGYLITRR